jgi:hypothetical protein
MFAALISNVFKKSGRRWDLLLNLHDYTGDLLSGVLEKDVN